jgi:hypothetical protein
MKNQDVKIVQQESEPIAVEVLAKSIVDLDRMAKRIASCGLTTRAIALLLWDMLPGDRPSRGQISMVLDALPRLASVHAPKAKMK